MIDVTTKNPRSRQASSRPRHSIDHTRLIPALAGLPTLTWLQLRSHLVRVIMTAGLLAGLVGASASQFKDLYPDEAARTAYSQTVGISGPSILFNGRGYDLTTLGGILTFEMGLITISVYPIVVVLLMIALTRREEEAGRTDLVTAAPVGRLSPLFAAMIVTFVTLALEGALVAGSLIALDYPVGGSLLYALALCLHQALWAGVGAVAAQVWQTGRAAATWSVLLIGATYVVRGVLDLRTDVKWAFPLQWQAETKPFGDVSWLAYALLAAGTVVAVAVAAALATHRDAGAGLFPARSGRVTASRQTATMTGLQLRHMAGGLVAWAVGSAGMGLTFGLMAEEMRRIFRENPQLAEAFVASGTNPDQALPTLTLSLVAVLAAASAMVEVQRIAAEERSGRTGLLLATHVRRTGWWLTTLLVMGTATVLVLVAGGLGSGLGTWASGAAGEGIVGTHVGDALAFAPAVLAMAAFGALLVSGHPAVVTLGWLPVTWAGIVAFLAELLDLPRWARDLSPLEMIGKIPAEAPDRPATAALAAAALVMVVASAMLIRRRDLVRG